MPLAFAVRSKFGQYSASTKIPKQGRVRRKKRRAAPGKSNGKQVTVASGCSRCNHSRPAGRGVGE